MKASLPGREPMDRISLDDLKHRAEAVRDLAVSDTKDAVARVLHQEATRTLLIVAGIVVLAASVSYLLGSRNARGFHGGDGF